MSYENINKAEIEESFDFEILEASETTALEEMGASSTICAGSTCSGHRAELGSGLAP